MLRRHQRRRGLLGAQTSPATPETPRCSDIASYARTPRCSDIASYARDSSVLRHRQLHRRLLGARTSLATLGTPRCSDIISYAGDSSVLRHHQLRRGLLGARTSPATSGTRRSDIVSYAGDSSVFGFFVQASPAKLRAPLVVGYCYVSSVCYQAAPCCSHQGANLGQHVWGLDTRMSDDVGKLSDFFDPATRFILHLPAGSGTKWAHFTLR